MFFATCSVGGCVERIDVLDHRCCVRRAGDAQRSGESSPPDRFACALRYGMQPSTPPRKSTRWINGHGEIAVPDRHSYHSKQFDGQLSLSATDTRPHRSFDASVRRGRSLALDHGLVYLHSTSGQNHPRCPSLASRGIPPASAHRHRASGRAPSRGWRRAPGDPHPDLANPHGCRFAIR
jgi:hypothetical protein